MALGVPILKHFRVYTIPNACVSLLCIIFTVPVFDLHMSKFDKNKQIFCQIFIRDK